jgi:acetyl-CoA carboxylase carboxyltransferase component
VNETLALQSRVPGAASASARTLESGREVIWVDIDSSARKGALTADASSVIESSARQALASKRPLVLEMGSSGADIDEGIASLHGWGRAARAVTQCSGIVPIFFIVEGPAVSGPALMLGLSDFVILTEDAYAFVSGPAMVTQFTGIEIGNEELGGAGTLARASGVASIVVSDVESARESVDQILAFLPDNTDELPEQFPSSDPGDRQTPEAGELIPESSTGSYDVRNVIASIVDDGDYLELKPRWAANVVTAFATMGGRTVGIIANQPMVLAGTLDIPASQKAARFVTLCDAFNISIITLVDTPGFYPGKDLEWRGMIRHGAQLVFAYGRATVPRICVILRKSYGGAYIVMDSKRMGNDLCLAWPWAELAVMGAGQASAILQRKATDEEKAEFEADYAERLLNPYVAAECGLVDSVVTPAETRSEIVAALEMLADKREKLIKRKHDNSPL